MDDDFSNVSMKKLNKFTPKWVSRAKGEDYLKKTLKAQLNAITVTKEKKLLVDDYYKLLQQEYKDGKKKAGLSGVKEDTILKASRGNLPVSAVKPLKGKSKGKKAPKPQPKLEEGLDEACLTRLRTIRDTREDNKILERAKRTRKKPEIMDPSPVDGDKAVKAKERKKTQIEVFESIKKKREFKENQPTNANDKENQAPNKDKQATEANNKQQATTSNKRASKQK